MTCDLSRLNLRARVADPGAGPAGADWLGHLVACAACRREALAAEPSLLFALAAASVAFDAPEPDWTGFNLRIRTAIEEESRRSGAFRRLLDFGVLAPRRLVPALGLAAAVLVALVAGWEVSRRPALVPAPLQAQGPVNAPSGLGRNLTVIAPASFSAPPPMEVASPTARVVHLTLGDPGGSAAAPYAAARGEGEGSDVVLIFDETMDL